MCLLLAVFPLFALAAQGDDVTGGDFPTELYSDGVMIERDGTLFTLPTNLDNRYAALCTGFADDVTDGVIPVEVFYKSKKFQVRLSQDQYLRNTIKLRSITFQLPITKYISKSFTRETSLEEVYLPPTCDSIGSEAFQDCSNLRVISFPGVKTIGMNAFMNCSSLAEFNAPNCKTISSYAFMNCSSLAEFNAPNCKTISSYAFMNCLSLAEFSVPNCEYLGECAFANCTSLRKTNIGHVVTLPWSAFQGCVSLSQVDLRSVRSIGQNAFNGCVSLSHVDLRSVRISKGAFKGCTSLKQIDLHQVDTLFSGALSESGITELVIPEKLMGGYREISFNEVNRGLTDPRLQSSCSYMDSLRRVTFEGKASSIPAKMFAVCPNLESVNLPEGLRLIDMGAFKDCPSLRDISFGPQLQYISLDAFNNTGLKEWDIPSVSYLWDGAFGNCVFERVVYRHDIQFPIHKIHLNGYDPQPLLFPTSRGGGFNCSIIKELVIAEDEGLSEIDIHLSPTHIEKLVVPRGIKAVRGSVGAIDSLVLQHEVDLTQATFTSIYQYWVNPKTFNAGRHGDYDESCYGAYPTDSPGIVVTCLSSTPPACLEGTFEKKLRLYVPSSALESYLATPGWRDFPEIVGFDPDGISNKEVQLPPSATAWYTLQGVRLPSRPSTPGLYIQGGRKVAIN